jgi:hypothetical protein
LKIIEVTLSELEEKITETLQKRSLTTNQISFLLEGYGWPLSPWQLSHILSQMTRMGVLERQKKGHVYRYQLSNLNELDSMS